MRELVRSAEPGSLEIRGYSGLCLIGEGAMAAVYLAVQDSLGREVALKILKRSDDHARYERFLNESRIIASLNHRNVITIYDVGIVDERPYISMEYLEGGDLESKLRDESLEPDDALELVEAIGSCLEFVHQRGIVHRDVKPANILFHKDSTPILTDFGVAKRQESESRLTIEGITLGTPYYLSPEQAECKPVDGRTDIYALGIILYEMLVGHRPYDGGSAMETIVSHLMDPIPTLPEELSRYQELIERMLAKNPIERFSTAEEMLEHVRELRRSGNRGKHSMRRDELTKLLSDNPRRAIEELAAKARQHGEVMLAAARRWYGQASPRTRLLAAVAATFLLLVGGGILVRRPATVMDDYLFRAEAALREDRLSYPIEGSAYYYYDRVLEVDPDNEEALQGVTRVAERYAELAEQDIAVGRNTSARTYISHGLEVQADNTRLLALEKAIEPSENRGERRVFSRIRSLLNPNQKKD